MLNLSTDQILNFNTLPTKCTEMNGELPDVAEYTLCILPLTDSTLAYSAACHGAAYGEQTTRYLAANCGSTVRLQTSASRMSPDQMMRGSPQSDSALQDSPAVSPQPDLGSQCLGSPAFSDISTDSSPPTSTGLCDTVPSLDSVHSVPPYTPPSSSEESDEHDTDSMLFSGNFDMAGLETFGEIPAQSAQLQHPVTSPVTCSEAEDEDEAENEVLFYRTLELGTEEGVMKHVRMILNQFERGIYPDIAPKTGETAMSATPYTDVVENKKKAKDGKVKRPMNSFFTFSRVYRRKIIGSRPNGVHNNVISSHLGRVWKSPLFEQHFKDFFKDGAQHMKLLHSKEFPEYRYRPRKKEKKAEEKVSSRTSSGRVSKPRPRSRKGGKGATRPLTPLPSEASSDITGPVTPATTTSLTSEISYSPATGPLSPQTFAPTLSPITPTPTRPVTPGEEVTGQGSPLTSTHSPITISLSPANPLSTAPGSPKSTSPGSLILSVNPSVVGTRLTPYTSSSGRVAGIALSGQDASQVSNFLADTMSVICSDIAGSAPPSTIVTPTTSLRSPGGHSDLGVDSMDLMDCELGSVVEDANVDLYDLGIAADLKFSKEDVYQFNEYCERIEMCADTQ